MYSTYDMPYMFCFLVNHFNHVKIYILVFILEVINLTFQMSYKHSHIIICNLECALIWLD